MGKTLLWIFSFLLLVFVGDRLIGYWFNQITQHSQFRFSKLYGSSDSANIVFLGNSRGLTFYVPEAEVVTQKKCVNLSYNGMPADLSKNLFFDYLDHHPKPETVIIDVTMCDRNNDPLKSGFLLYTPFSNRLDTLIRGINSLSEGIGKKITYGGAISHLYRYNNELFQRVLFHRNKTDRDVINDKIISDLAVNDTAFKSYQVRMFTERVTDLKEIIDTAKARNIAVKLVINPYYPAFADVLRDSFLSPLKNYVEQVTQMPVSDFSKSLNARDEFADYQHANKKGSEHYMTVLNENHIFEVKSETLTLTPPFNETPNEEKKDVTLQNVNNSLNVNVAPSKKKLNKVSHSSKRGNSNANWISVDTMFIN